MFFLLSGPKLLFLGVLLTFQIFSLVWMIEAPSANVSQMGVMNYLPCCS